MKADQERVKNLLTDTVTLLCKNGLLFSDELRIEGLLGVTVDNKDAFFVHISEKFGTGAESENSEDSNLSVKKSKKSKVHQDSPASPKSVPSRPSSSASSHAASPRHHPAPNVKIKRERDDDDLIMVDSKPSCMMSQPRVPPTHGGPVFPGLESQGANFRQFPLSNQSHSKRQKVNNQPFVTGMARHVNEPNSDNSASNPWQNLASQVGGGRAGQSDAQIAPWPSPGGSQLGMQSGNPDMVGGTDGLDSSWIVQEKPLRAKAHQCPYEGCNFTCGDSGALYRHRKACEHRTELADEMLNQQRYKPRSRTSADKPHKCNNPGCGKTFYHSPSLYRHGKSCAFKLTNMDNYLHPAEPRDISTEMLSRGHNFSETEEDLAIKQGAIDLEVERLSGLCGKMEDI